VTERRGGTPSHPRQPLYVKGDSCDRVRNSRARRDRYHRAVLRPAPGPRVSARHDRTRPHDRLRDRLQQHNFVNGITHRRCRSPREAAAPGLSVGPCFSEPVAHTGDDSRRIYLSASPVKAIGTVGSPRVLTTPASPPRHKAAAACDGAAKRTECRSAGQERPARDPDTRVDRDARRAELARGRAKERRSGCIERLSPTADHGQGNVQTYGHDRLLRRIMGCATALASTGR
jgi:hypothetical protein